MQLISSQDTAPADALVLDNTADVLAHAVDVQRAGVVVLNFPKWTDGRAYSQAVLLRGRLRYTGDVIATGEVLSDMLPLLRRCGFDTAQLLAGQSQDAADRSLGFFPAHYQADPAHRARA